MLVLKSNLIIFISAESKFAVLQSAGKSIGKSTIMELVAHGLGVSSKKHPLMIAGGDGNKSGTST